jgi:hypothetical protein
MPDITPFVTMDEVVANSATLIKETGTKHRNLLRQWTYLGERQLGWSGDHKDAKQIDVVNLAIQKPSNYAVGIDLALFDANGVEYAYHYRGKGKRIHSEYLLSGAALGSGIINTSEIGISSDPYYFYLDSIGENVTYANLIYFGYPVDEDGDLLIPEHHLFPLMHFNRWMWMMRENYPENSINQAERVWLRESVKAKSKNKIPDMLEGRDIARVHNSMIDKVFYTKF